MRAQDDPKGLRIINSVADTGFRGAYIMGVTGAVQGGITGAPIGMMIADAPGIFLGALCGTIAALCIGAVTGMLSFLLARLVRRDDIGRRMDRIEQGAIRGSVAGVAIGAGSSVLQALLSSDINGGGILAIIAGFIIGTFIGALTGARARLTTGEQEPRYLAQRSTNDPPDGSWLRIDVDGDFDQVHVRIAEVNRTDRPERAGAEHGSLHYRDILRADMSECRIQIGGGDEAEIGGAGGGMRGLRLELPSPLMQIDLLLPDQQSPPPLAVADGPEAEHTRIEIAGDADVGNGEHKMIEPIDLHIRYR